MRVDLQNLQAVASLGWVSSGAANEGVTPIFSASHHRLPVLRVSPLLLKK